LQLSHIGESDIGLVCPSKGFKNNAFVIPSFRKERIDLESSIIGLDGLIVLVLLTQNNAFIVPC
jgi:hypothetical protein